MSLNEEDADYAPFDLKRQLWIDQYLEDVYTKIDEYKDSKNTQEVVVIQEAITELRDTQNQKTKNQVARGIAKILSRIQKSFNLSTFKRIYKPISDEVYKWVIKKGLDTGFNNFPDITDINALP